MVPTKEWEDAYLHSLLKEIDLRIPLFLNRRIVSLYLGGGTPFLLQPKRIQAILDHLPPLQNDCEITLEANPESTTKDLLIEYRQTGINRLSLGVQSFNDHELKILGRSHRSKDVYRVIDEAISADFSNISIDLMYELVSQTLTFWEHSLLSACRLPLHHISLYNLVVEPNSVWHRKEKAIRIEQPEDEVALEMYKMAIEKTAAHGFTQYEISAFARAGAISKHNVGYWKGREFLGFGPSAFSFFDGKRFSNYSNLKKYCSALEREELAIDFVDETSDRLREMIAVGLRMTEGVVFSEAEAAWGKGDADLKDTLAKLTSWGLITNHNGILMLTDQGRVLYDSIASEII